MTLASDPPKEGFRLSMLIYDTRFRSITIQVVVLLLFLAGLFWLLNNAYVNLEAKGKDFNFSFLWSRAGYDIAQTLIPYTNDDTHMRALVVGLLNTLLVSVLGCVLATLVGTVVGVLRLSHNWLVARLMTVYVETFRNIPLLLWILLMGTILAETRPSPRDFRFTDAMREAGQTPEASMWFFDTIAVTNRGTSVAAPVFSNSLGTVVLPGNIPLSLNALVLMVVLAASFFGWRLLMRRAKALQEATGVRPTTWWQTPLVLFGPAAVVSVLLGLHLDYPTITRFDFEGGFQMLHSFTALLIALTVYTSAFIAEIVRAGIMAISKGQTEAAYALGLRPSRTMNLVILPQALRVIVPPLISQFLNLTKNSSLAIAVSYMDLRGTLGGITLNQTGRELECMLLMMLIYLTISLVISSVMNIYNKSIKLKER
ncbi:L-glutamine ABC transporter membrane protein /L-glutamate ABC transporter membrane protein /L-aspartate ABC transporter membrane protein /L-asparagine ABC transporter membrane protein [Rhodobacter aestuarii]|uniref:L-glutamine ABC transporter membrane protein /L-glutamate ABC transporter membrane protein /L-aspartate ABC transporter membrane protein /L-asparagine ABC transporter membrane protein n=1 Tax=Rhodobacter aestuarii TaxID=453582 RepID=A0A1N7KFJ4_9RHOB|nr:ABC transporter permease subunit [Rhodobacter aestuarii]PTV95714.1 L-glutamine ABC transporter membrane protein /L-glutamate ABC transporter membrane protein /L-aspartate ABC transporter membrane protein /L-asparagine ABC transporter membrane protein [Rhodobacter aestuarii]SIS60361.1 L-glutamine ABC transporter membrane protein /L-glutamate ABC transporter membrane protein /L-aspartate ABC transporter membrane protein /L-asparagine ABC transporter membrane protein [Rhodobacter aestuarii]